MQTNVIKSICPNCGAADCEEILTYSLIDNMLSTECKCPICRETWRNMYGLFYLGYSDKNGIFDRDGLELRY